SFLLSILTILLAALGCLTLGKQLMTMKTRVLYGLAFALIAVHSEAATITPASPTEQDVIIASIDVASSGVYKPPSTSVVGNMIRTNLPLYSFVLGPPIFIAHQYASF